MRDGVLTKAEAFAEINKIQDDYIDELMKLIDSPDYEAMKTIDFTSATGTGKTKMMSKLINRYPNCYFIITTLSKGQLHIQTRNNLFKDCNNDNFVVYGTADYKINSRLQAQDIIDKIPLNTKCIWLRDEGHIKTNKYDELLEEKCYKVINFSTTNIHNDIKCNFTQTMMLRTVNQENGTVDHAICKLLEIKKAHKNVANYNPCAIFRCVKNDNKIYRRIIELCKKNKLKYIDITNEPFIMAELCDDDNEYDVIINKMKIVEGIDIRRAHVLFMDNQPSNVATTIQVIGRCRRNALLYRDDIDILDPSNKELLKNTRECYVYYNVDEMRVSTDETGELQYAFCNHISCQELKSGMSINVENGQLSNGLYVVELANKTGRFNIEVDENTGFNIVKPITDFYKEEVEKINVKYLYNYAGKINVNYVKKYFPLNNNYFPLGYDVDGCSKDVPLNNYEISGSQTKKNLKFSIPENVMLTLNKFLDIYSKEYIYNQITDVCLDLTFDTNEDYSIDEISKEIDDYLLNNRKQKGNSGFCTFVDSIDKMSTNYYKVCDMCSNTELLMLKHYCIRKRQDGLPTSAFRELIKNKINSRCKYVMGIYGDARDYFKKIVSSNLSVAHMRKYVNEYIRKTADDDFENSDSLSFVFEEDIDGYFKGFEQTIVKYYCVKLREKGYSTSEIVKEIDDFKNFKRSILLNDGTNNLDKITYLILKEDINDVYPYLYNKEFTIELYPPNQLTITENDVVAYFEEIEDLFTKMKNEHVYFADSKKAIDSIVSTIRNLKYELDNNIINTVNYHLDSLFEPLTQEDMLSIKKRYIKFTYEITENDLNKMCDNEEYYKIVNDFESSIIGVDLMKQFKTEDGDIVWDELRTVSSKVSGFNKLNIFISKKYKKELEESRSKVFTGKNRFELDSKCNSMIGYCVEYYSKYLVYGREYLEAYIEKAMYKKGRYYTDEECLIVRACMLKYTDDMTKSFGIGVSSVIKTISLEKLPEYKKFVNLVVELGKRTARYVTTELYPNTKPKDDVNPDLSIRHISGLADYITSDTILDVKVRNNIDERCIRQVLAYYYLSTKRSDLHINRVMVYDAVSDKAVVIKISEDNLNNKNVFDC